jgi:hypothetical protein
MIALQALVIVLIFATGASATTIDIGEVSATASGPGTLTGAFGPAGVDVSLTGTYSFDLTVKNTTGTSGSEANALSFFDVFIELDLDGNVVPCGGVASLAAGASFSCSTEFALTTGHHYSAGAFLDLTLATNPLLLTDATMFDADEVSAGGPSVPLAPPDKKKGKPGIYVGIAVAAGGGIGAAVALSGGKKTATVPEPGTLALVGTGVLAVALARAIRIGGGESPTSR